MSCRRRSFDALPALTFAIALLIALAAAPARAQSQPNGDHDPARDPAKAAFIFERIENRVRFENDGTGLRETSALVRVQSQAGVRDFGQLVFGYSSATESLDVNYVRVRKPDGRLVETPPANAQDMTPEVLQAAPMYSDYRQRHISVVDLQPGDLLEYRTTTHITTSVIPGHFWYEHSFPKGVFVSEDRLVVDVPKERALKLKSPDRRYETADAADRRTYTWDIKDIAPPPAKKDDDQSSDADSEDDAAADVQLSTFTDWQQVAHWYGKLADSQTAVDDDLRKKAADLTRGASTASDRVRRLYDFVAGNIRYVSLSFGVGRYQPHSASEVLHNGYGDCKDKHTLLAALLRAENIASVPVLIHSSRKLDPDMPSPAQFDHVISAVRVGENTIWLDTTAEVAPFGLIFYQLRDKQALFASNDASAGLRRTPADSPIHNMVTLNLDGKFSAQGAFDGVMDATAQGDSDVPLRAAFRAYPQARWEELLKVFSAAWGFDGDISDMHLSPIEDTSKPLHLTYHVHKDDYFNVPSRDVRFFGAPPILLDRLPANRKSVEPLDVGPAVERLYRVRLQFPPNFSFRTPPAVKISRDYGDYSTSYTVTKDTLQAERRLDLRVNRLPAARRSDFESFRNVVVDPVSQVISGEIGAPSGTSGTAVAAASDATPQALRKAATSAMNRDDFAAAANLLKQVVDKNPTEADAWYDLGRAYARLNDHDQAIRAFRKQIEINSFHPHANADLAAELQLQGHPQDAVSAYRRQLEINPTDKTVHKSLGLLLAQLKQDQDARPELESASTESPDDPEIKLALGQLYSRAGEADKARAITRGVLGGASLAEGADLYAQALKDDMDKDQSLRDARRTLDDIGDQFDAGDYERLGPSAFSAMNLVALSWARIGWARFLQQEYLEAAQFLNAAWLLSQSGTVANRMARVLLKEGQPEKSRHLFALAVAAGGEDATSSRQELLRLSSGPDAAQREIDLAQHELLRARTIPLPALTPNTASATFNLVFSSASRPERVEYFSGDAALRPAADPLRMKDYPVKFPDVSSVKIVRQGTVSCTNSSCSIVLMPIVPASAVPDEKAR